MGMMPQMEPRTMLVLSISLCVVAALALIVVASERHAMERTLAEIRNLPEGH